jgi:hypothetical protein
MTADVFLGGTQESLPPRDRLPVLLLSQYAFFLSRRPVSQSNLHYLVSRLQGLKALAPLFAESGNPILDRVVSQLGRLHPAAFRRLAPSLQLSLMPLVSGAWRLPGHVIVQDAPPPAGWMAGARRALIVFGPGIGIGDELIMAPLPQWLSSANPEMQVDTLSGYRGFWNRVAATGRALQYSSLLDLHRALSGSPPYDGYDLVVFADFESPELYRGVVADARIGKYLEISLGARSAYLFDAERQWLYRLHHPDPYFSNYYYALNHLLRALGLQPRARDRFADVVTRTGLKATDRLDVFVSPFTSKYDPSGVYWSRLLSALARHAGPTPLTLHLDAGNNWKTQRFAVELARSVVATLPPNVEVRLARDEGSQALTLSSVYDHLERCHAVVCADSFAAHAGPLFGCTTLVVAKAELRDWHVPSDTAFYFDAASPVGEVAATMGSLLFEMVLPKSRMDLAAMFSQAELELCAWGDALETELERGGLPDLDLYRKFAVHHGVVCGRRRDGDKPPELLFSNSFTGDVRVPDPEASSAMAIHLRDQLERWQNTNFSKYLRGAARRAGQEQELDSGPRKPSRGREPAAGAAQASPMGSALLNSIRAILREQLPSGEIATYFRFGEKAALEYRRSPLISSFVHDCLGNFDLKSRWVDVAFLDALPPGVQGRFVRAAAMVRDRIRAFLMWEEGNDGGWRFRGRASGLGPDPDTTACAAASVTQAARGMSMPRWQAQTETLLRSHGADLVSEVNILRFFALIGEPTAALEEKILASLTDGELRSASERYGHPLVLPYCIARAWAQGGLPGRGRVAEVLIPHVLAAVQEDGDSVLGTALALNTWVDLEYRGPEVIAAGQHLLETVLPRGGWGYEPFLEDAGGAPAATSAFAMAALARSGVGR